ncbi:MAG TPA: ATP phosphoribosyltransferase [Gemmatimonadaceae bacterium]|nr:ATP phosphoribosyltransferase [Gemmatimonadaceae bacterium]
MLRVALPNKGRLASAARELLAEAGLPVAATDDRALTASLGGEFEALFVRAEDVPEFVADGAADAGVTGWDLVCESARALESRLDLGVGRCHLVVAVREDRGIHALEQLPPRTRVATAFSRLTREFFRRRHVPVEIVPISGAAEVAPRLGIADAIVDLTSSGTTLRANGLRPIATILDSTAHLVTGAAWHDAVKHAALEDLALALRSVVLARDQRYVMANLPRAALERVREVLPGLAGPTVTGVMNCGAHVAVHAVVPAASVFRTIARLKALGGEGILVTRIERLIP